MSTADSRDHRALLQRAFVELKDARDKLAAEQQAKTEPIAIVGIGCRFPGGAVTPEAFWQLLRDGVDTIGAVPADRWDTQALFDSNPDAPGKMSTAWGGFIADVDRFDAQFFGIAPREATWMDPQQRLLLECAWEALEDAGQTADRLAGSATGVFVGVCNTDYSRLDDAGAAAVDAYTGTGNAYSVAAGRIAYFLDLRGPAIAIDTACSSSLVGVHLAVKSLRAKETRLALAGGVNLMLSPLPSITASKMRIMSPDGRCKTFDARADGYVRGEGCGVIVLKRLSDAIADGDAIRAVIRGTAINQDGCTSGLTAPNGLAQQEVIRQALTDGGVAAHEITYVEAHGTGTPLGDPIEVEALSAVVGRPRQDGDRCALASVKTNIGHLEGAAGIAGLIKAALSIQHGEIPAHLNFRTLNPNISLAGTPLVIPTETRPWTPRAGRRFAGVSSFGFSGTNAHVVLGEAPVPSPRETAPERVLVLPLSARQPAALLAHIDAYERVLRGGVLLQDLCFTGAVRRTHHPHRVAIVGRTHHEMLECIPAARVAAIASQPGAGGKLVLVFSGLGGQWFGMGRQLLAENRVFRDSLADIDEALRPFIQRSVLDLIERQEDTGQLGNASVAQPALFALQVAFAAMFRACGVVPDAVVGHSMGEVAAAHVAGVLTLPDAARIIACRSELLTRVSGAGAMALAELTAAEAEALIQECNGGVEIAVMNGPRSTVLAGEAGALRAIVATLESRGVFSRWIKADIASHTAQMDPLLGELAERLHDLRPVSATLPLYSTVTGDAIDGRECDARYWVRNLREPVRFWPAVQRLTATGHSIFLECSPHPVLGPAIDEGLSALGRPGAVLSTMRRDEDQRRGFLDAVSRLYALGLPIDWAQVYADAGGSCVPLPPYAWQRERFWLAPIERSVTPVARSSSHPLLGVLIHLSSPEHTHCWEASLSLSRIPALGDHRVQGVVVVPAAALIDTALSAAAQLWPEAASRLQDVAFHRALALAEGGDTVFQVVFSEVASDTATFRCSTRPAKDGASWTLHAEGIVHHGADERVLTACVDIARIRERCAETLTADAFYDAVAAQGLSYGPAFRGLTDLCRRDGEALALIRVSASPLNDPTRSRIPPAVLDSAMQAVGATFAGEQVRSGTYVPVAVKTVRLGGDVSGAVWSHVVRRDASMDPLASSMLPSADVLLLDASGVVLAEVLGLQIQPLDTAADRAEDSLARWLYAIEWRPKPHIDALPGAPSGRWLILGDRGEAAMRIADVLTARGASCEVIEPHEIADCADRLGAFHGIVHAGALNAPLPAALTARSLAEAQDDGCHSVLRVAQSIVRAAVRDVPRLWLVTRSTQEAMDGDAVSGIAHSPIWGLARVIAHEHPELRCTVVDLDDETSVDTLSALATELFSGSDEDQIALRGGTRFVSRLVRAVGAEKPQDEHANSRIPAGDRPYRLEIDKVGVLDRLTLRETSQGEPAAGEVAIRVAAAGLNFNDVMKAMGIYPGVGGGVVPLGNECAGIITAVGAGVEGIAVGDAVVGLAPFSLGTNIVTPAVLVAPKPPHLTFEQAAALPVAFLTASYALEHVGRLMPGERVLIHSAAGGVGLAALQLARQHAAEVFVTAGTPEKRELLRSLGAAHAMDSRSLCFADEVLECTSGRGVDVVLNSLSGEAIAKSLSILAPYGRFLELGKRDIYQNRQIGLWPFRKALSFNVIDLAALVVDRPALLGDLLRDIMRRFADGTLQPLPIQVFNPPDAVEAFRTMAQGRHTGKLVVRFEDQQASIVPAKPADDAPLRGTYLITGGLGGLALTVARWLVTHGVRDVVLVGRSAASDAARQAIGVLTDLGARVVVAQADVARHDQLADVFSAAARDLPPIAGVIHAAVDLDDGVVMQLNEARCARVFRPKIAGAWNLHLLTRDLPIERFILFSSGASLLGSPGQGNYAAANAFLDALAHYRRAQGRPVTCINWGPWSEVGLAARPDRGGRLEVRGIGSFTPAEGVEVFARIVRDRPVQVAALRLDVRQWQQFYPKTAQSPLLSEILGTDPHRATAVADSSFRVALLALESGWQRQAMLEKQLREEIAQVLRLSPNRIDRETPLQNLGLDSLMALELRNRLEASLGLTLSATLIWGYPTVATLAPHLAARMGVSLDVDETARPATPAETPEDLNAVAALSADDTRSLLETELDELSEELLGRD